MAVIVVRSVIGGASGRLSNTTRMPWSRPRRSRYPSSWRSPAGRGPAWPVRRYLQCQCLALPVTFSVRRRPGPADEQIDPATTDAVLTTDIAAAVHDPQQEAPDDQLARGLERQQALHRDSGDARLARTAGSGGLDAHPGGMTSRDLGPRCPRRTAAGGQPDGETPGHQAGKQTDPAGFPGADRKETNAGVGTTTKHRPAGRCGTRWWGRPAGTFYAESVCRISFGRGTSDKAEETGPWIA